jgi:hypothetical protein
VSPCGSSVWYSQHPVNNLVNMHSLLPHYLPCSLSYIHVSCQVSVHIAKLVTESISMSAFVLPSHPAMSASVQPVFFRTSTCQPVIGPCHVWTSMCHVHTRPHVISVLVQLIPKIPKPSDTCHLVLPHFLVDITCRTADVNNTAC